MGPLGGDGSRPIGFEEKTDDDSATRRQSSASAEVCTSSIFGRKRTMKICVFGAGAIGGYLAAELALAGHEVSAIVRGTHLDAIRENGLKLIIEGKEKATRIAASSNSSDFGPQDYVISTLKAHQSHE